MDRYVKALTIFLTSLILGVKCSSLIAPGESETDDAHDRFLLSSLEDGEELVKLISSKYERSLFVEIRNNMAGSPGTATVISDCYAYSNSGQLLSALGASPMLPTRTTIYWMNLIYFTPSVGAVDCNITAPAGNYSKTLTMYDDNNMELSYLSISWSIDERGFSLYNSVSNNFYLYQSW